MMLVVAVALSTATYAWFTSSDSVTAKSLTMTAAVNDAAALEISYVNTEAGWMTEIVATNPTGSFNPAAPDVFALANPSATPDPILATLYDSITWANSDVINGKFKAAGTGNQQYVWNDGTGGHTSFYLHNGSTANVIQSVTMTAEITGDAAPFIRIGVFKYNSTRSDFELVGVISNLVNYTKAVSADWTSSSDQFYTSTNPTADAVTYESQAAFDAVAMKYKKTTNYAGVTVGAITKGKDIGDMTNPTICTSSVSLGTLAVNNNDVGGADEMQLRIAIWMDGSALNDDTAGGTPGKDAAIKLNFAASRS